MDKIFKSCLYIINRDCNLNCNFCVNSKIDIENAKLVDVKKGLKVISELTDFLVIMGGEPLLYKDIIEIVKYLNNISLEFTIVTNGTLLGYGEIKLLQEAGLKNITVSMDVYKNNNIESIIKLKEYFSDVSANIVYDTNFVGSLYDIIKQLTSNDVWSIIALYNSYMSTNRKHYLINKKNKFNSFKLGQYSKVRIETNKILDNFEDLLIHNSKEYIKGIPLQLYTQKWHCDYPYRLVVNNDLKIMVCEDFEPFDIDIFDLKDIINKIGFSYYVDMFKLRVKKCEGCYLPCYYDVERLTPKQIAHRRSIK